MTDIIEKYQNAIPDQYEQMWEDIRLEYIGTNNYTSFLQKFLFKIATTDLQKEIITKLYNIVDAIFLDDTDYVLYRINKNPEEIKKDLSNLLIDKNFDTFKFLIYHHENFDTTLMLEGENLNEYATLENMEYLYKNEWFKNLDYVEKIFLQACDVEDDLLLLYLINDCKLDIPDSVVLECIVVNNEEFLELFINNGLDLNKKIKFDRKNTYPIQIAGKFKFNNLVKLMIKNGDDTNKLIHPICKDYFNQCNIDWIYKHLSIQNYKYKTTYQPKNYFRVCQNPNERHYCFMDQINYDCVECDYFMGKSIYYPL